VFAAVAASGAMIGGGHAFDRFSLVPVVMHLDRTKRVASRYRTVTYAQKETGFFEAQLMRDSNGSIRELLLSNGHLLPEQLRRPAHLRVEHYDVWLRRFDAKVAREGPNPKSTFDVGLRRLNSRPMLRRSSTPGTRPFGRSCTAWTQCRSMSGNSTR
jgi:hypothetical protein